MPQNPNNSPPPGEGLDTGSAGFDIDGNTFTMDTGMPGSPTGYGPHVKKVDVDKDLVDSAGRPKDISTPTRLTLGRYLSDVTTGKRGTARVPNRYPVSAPAPNAPTQSTSDSRGNPLGPEPVGDVNASFFGGTVDPYSRQYPVIQPDLRKGKSSRGTVDGNDLLKTESGVAGSPVTRYQSAVLANNRFAAAGTNLQKSFTDASKTSVVGFDPSLSPQRTLGVYDPTAPAVSTSRLAAVGPLLTMRAGKELGSSDPGADPNSGNLQAGALLPGLGQLGVTRIDQQLLLASDVLSTLTSDELEASSVISPGSLSWGSLNNVDDPFSGTDAVGMLVLSTALLAGIEVLIDALSVLLGTITPSVKKPGRDAQGRYTLGEYLPGSKQAKKAASGGIGGALSALSSLNFGALLGIQPTNYPFNRALTVGLNAFFGIPDSSGGGIGVNQLAGAVSSSTDSPGFNVVVARSIIRSSLTIVDQLKKVGGNPLNAVTQTLALVDVIRSSKVVSACNVFSSLGDAILSNPNAFVDSDSPSVKVSTMDSRGDVVAGAVGKNRLKGSLKLAWASNTAPANVLLPASIIGTSIALGNKNLGQFSPWLGIQQDAYSQVQSTVTTKDNYGRIPIEDALEFEKRLESSYVPFYFHDVRTNEMVSFHAFLSSLTDDYNASFDRSEGFGRVEPVKIYKGTERKINLSFFVVATSLLDFDEMYVKLNKLVTLVYPQYTEGVRLMSADGSSYSFTQPFSQLVGASPLIRLRLGDLLRSNYSLFALGRLFGMGNQDFTVNGQKFTGDSAVDQGVLNDLSQKVQEALGVGPSNGNPSGGTYVAADGSYEQFVDTGTGLGGGLGISAPQLPGIGSGGAPKFAPVFRPGDAPGPLVPFLVKAKRVHPDNPFLIIGEVVFNDSIGYSEKFTPGYKKQVDEHFNNADVPLQKYIGGTYVFPITALTPTDRTMTEVVAKLSALSNLDSQNSGFTAELASFLNPDGDGANAVARSFKDTGGKGLAGFIETMSFDWYDKSTWETSSGRIAPKICKVTIGFSPVHDISPGIDHLGFNRGPLYPVGVMGPQQGRGQ